MNQNNKYMDLYRKLELTLKNHGFESIKAYEDSLGEDIKKQGQIRICRLMRNYMEHEDISFIDASDKMMDFLQEEIYKFDTMELPVKKKMIPVKYGIKDTDPIIIAASFMNKRKLEAIPVFDKANFAVGILTTQDILKCISSGDYSKAKKVSIAWSSYKFNFVNENTPMSQIMPFLNNEKIYLVLSNDKKVVGWIC